MDVRLAKNGNPSQKPRRYLALFQAVFQGGLWGTESAMKEVNPSQIEGTFFPLFPIFLFPSSKIG